MAVSLRKTSVSAVIKRAAAAAILTAATSAAMALPSFTFNPSAAGLDGDAFTADNLLISNYSTVLLTGSGFTQSGYLSIGSAQLGGSTFTPDGLNSDYGIYIAYSAEGTSSAGNPGTDFTFGHISSLTYTIYGYNGSASFGFSGNTPTETALGEIVLASGSLISGTVATVPTGNGTSFSPSANAELTFSALNSAFFQEPQPFYDLALTAFSNTSSQVQTFDGGFTISQGGGSINFAASVVPEPSSYAMLLAGLGAVGFVLRRRRV
jgi:PEP-CTERM motif